MDVRTLLRWPLWALSGRFRKAAYARARPWLAKRGPCVLRCSGILMEVDFSENGDYRLFVRGKLESAVQAVILSVLAPGATFFDVGANRGYFALLAADRAGPGGRAWAFEPEPENTKRIRRNFALNPGLAVTLEPVAVSSMAGEATFMAGDNSGHGSIVEGFEVAAGRPITVPTVSLDGYLEENGIDRVDVMKMDIEGAEVQAIEGMASGLPAGRYGDIIIEWHGSHHGELGTRPAQALELLVSSGYDLFVIERRRKTEPIKPEAVPAERVHLFCRASRS